MSAPSQDKDKKQSVKSAAPKVAAPGPRVTGDKADLRSVMRPAPAAGGMLRVGAAGDKAEAEAEQVAKALVSPEGTVTDRSEPKAADEDGPLGSPIRGPPVAVVGLGIKETGPAKIRRAPDPSGGQPHLDQLSNVPPLPSNMAQVTVRHEEECDLGEMTSKDWDTVSAAGVIQMARGPGAGAEGCTADAAVSHAVLNPAGGSPLPAPLRAAFEPRLGVDLSGVRVHSGEPARRLAARLGARAFAFRNHIWLRSGALIGDKHLVAHEVVHVVQQGAVPRRRLSHAQQARGPPRRKERPTPHRTYHFARAPPRASDPSATSGRDVYVLPLSQVDRAPAIRRDASGIDTGFLARSAESLADRLDSYAVLKAIIGRRLFTGETLPPSADGFVGPFMKFIGADETYQQLQQSGSLQRGYEYIKGALSSHDLTWRRVQRIFDDARETFSWTSPIESYERIFVPFFRDVVAFGVKVLKVIAELVAEAFVTAFGPNGRAVWEKIKAIGENIQLVLHDPMGFAKNLIRAVVKGVQGFGERIWTHIKAGLLAWVLGPFAAMGVQIPDKLDLKGIVSVILQVLGLTYPQLRPRIVRKLDPNGNVKVTFVERMIQVIQIMRTEGLAGIWRKLMEYVENLQMTVIGGIRDWVIRAVVTAGIRKLVAWSNPAGALIDILLTIYNVIVFFVEKFEQILDFATTVFDAIGRIARGEIDLAASAVERTLALTIPIIISFLVRLLGLPDIASTVRNIVTKIREKVHRAFDRVLDWIILKMKKLVAALVSRFRAGNETGKVPFTLDGTQHHMWAKRKGRRFELTMSSTKEHAVTDRADKQSKQSIQNSEDKVDKPAQSGLEAADPKGDQALADVQEMSAKPQTQQELPSEEEKIKKSIEEYTALIQKASQKSPDAAPPKPGQADGAPEPPQGHGATDRTDYPFRHVVRLNRPLEGAAGSWQQVTAEYNAARDAQPAGAKQDVSRNLHRDHIPVFDLLKKIATIYLAPATREGTIADKTPYPFKALSENLPYPATKESNPLLPVMVVRAFINLRAGAKSPLTDKLKADFKETKRGLEPKVAPATDAERTALVNGIFASFDGPNVAQDMNIHIDAVRTAYQDLAPGTIDVPAMMATIQQSTQTLRQQTAFIFGSGQPAAYQAGLQGDLRIPLSDQIVANELQFQKYRQLGETGGYLDRHHLLEREVVAAFQDQNKTLQTLEGYLAPDIDGLVEQASAASLGARTPEEQSAISAKPDKLAAIKAAVRSEAVDLKCPIRFKQEQRADVDGMAIFVLKSVNGQAGSQGTAGLDAGIVKLKSVIAGSARSSVTGALKAGFDTSLPMLAAGDASPEAAANVVHNALNAAGIADRITNDATLQAKGLLGALTGVAWDIWRPLQERVNQPLIEQRDKLDPAIYQKRIADQCLKRFGELTRSNVIQKNLDNWFV